jgi:DNA-binding CsgD family transcriptional regulator
VKTLSILERLACDLRRKERHAVSLIARPGEAQDLASCYVLRESLRLPYGEIRRRVLPEMWHSLLDSGAMRLCVVEDLTKSVGSRVVSFNAILFVTDAFCAEARSTLPPYLGIELAKRYLLHHLPVLNRQQIARANAGDGLNVLMCFEGRMQDGLSAEEVLLVREKQSKALRLALGGYRLKEFLAERIGEETSQWMLDGGARLRRDYSDYFRKNPALKPECWRRPFLVGLTKEEALAHPGSKLGGVFIYVPPRFHFSRSQRVLLRHALKGETCETVAASLSISPWTVKKHWHAIYERVADVDGALLPPPIAAGPHATSRGVERRRRLLNYLQQHPEELRPFKPAPRKRAITRHLLSAIIVFLAQQPLWAFA